LQGGGDVAHGLGHVAARRHQGDVFHAEQVEHEVVARGIGFVGAGHALFNHKLAAQAFYDSGGQGDAAVVGLRGTAGDQGVGALGQRVGGQKLQLAGFVAAREQTQHVVALDPNIGAHTTGAARGQGFGKARRVVNGRGRVGVVAAGEAGQIHEGSWWGQKINGL